MVGRLLAMAALAGCGFQPSEATSGDDAPDALVDVASSVCHSWHPHFFDPCAVPAPMGPLHLTKPNSPYVLDSRNGTLVDATSATVTVVVGTLDQAGGLETLVVSVDGLVVDAGAELAVVGARPVIVASWNDIEIDGGIDAGSYTNNAARTGAGSNPTSCAASAAMPGADEVDTGGGSGGGGGGAFGATGGHGGPGDTGAQNAGGVGGALASVLPQVVRGGCNGAPSGKAGPDVNVTAPSDANTIAAGGSGGGAIHIAANGKLALSGVVLAGGAGGFGAELHSAVGGGGGGAGGYVGLEGTTITIDNAALVAANGGGGGASSSFLTTGGAGEDGHASVRLAAAGGIPQSACAFNGGAGGIVAAADGVMASQAANACGGGGGGGSVGMIYVFGPAFVPSSTTFSPQPLVNPF